jgi:hypothetical protein
MCQEPFFSGLLRLTEGSYWTEKWPNKTFPERPGRRRVKFATDPSEIEYQ